jgi:hypothetical protein
MTHMLSVAAFKIGYPMVFLILVKADDSTNHSSMRLGRITAPWRLERLG